MTKDLVAAGSVLAKTLEAENSALASLDLPRAGSLLADKETAIAELAAAPVAPGQREAAERVARRLRALAAENKRLLERAIAAQGRVLGVVAQAAADTAAPKGYGTERGRRPVSVALTSRA